jgi:acyl-CoA dehydrogenase
MSRSDPALLDITRRILRAFADPASGLRARRDGDAAAIWRDLDETGLPRAWLAEAAGGADATLGDGFEILRQAGEVALDVPLAETLLAGWLLAAAGLDVPGGALASGGTDDGSVGLDGDGRLTGRLTGVAFARDAACLAVLGRRGGDAFVARVDRAACAIRPRDNLAGEPRDTVVLDGVAPEALATVPAGLAGLHDRWWAMGAVARSCQMAGALQAILARSVTYAGERVAFDRPIARFQAVQHMLARLADEAAVAVAASGSAADALAADTADADGVLLEVAGAKIRVGEAAAAGAAIAHQVHGAIGFSTEHALHRFTQRLWAWRDDFGSESAWAVRLGAAVLRWGDGLWPVLAAR